MDSKRRPPFSISEKVTEEKKTLALLAVKEKYDTLFASLQSLQVVLINPIDKTERRKKIFEAITLFRSYHGQLEELELPGNLLNEALSYLKSLYNNATFKKELPSLWEHFQEKIIHPVWHFHYHHIRYPNKPHTEKEYPQDLACYLVELLTPEERADLLQPQSSGVGSQNYLMVHKYLKPSPSDNPPSVDKALLADCLRTELNRQLGIQHLTPDLVSRMVSEVGIQATGRLVSAGTASHSLFKPALDKEKIKRLDEHGVRGGSLKAVDDYLQALEGDALRNALTRKITITDLVGREYEGTFYQVTLRAQDVAMLKIIIKHYARLEGGKDLRLAHHQNEIAKWKPQTTFDFTDVVNLITNALPADVKAALDKKTDSPLWKAMDEKFRKVFRERLLNEIPPNLEHFLKAIRVYDEQFDHWSWEKRDLFSRQVIGYVQCYLTATQLQDFAQGICYIVRGGEERRRQFNFRVGDRSVIPVLDSLSGLGFDFSGWGGFSWGEAARAGVLKSFGERYLRIISQEYMAAIGELNREEDLKPSSRLS